MEEPEGSNSRMALDALLNVDVDKTIAQFEMTIK